MDALENDGGQPMPVDVVRVQQNGAHPTSWPPSSEVGAGDPGVYVESFATDVPDVHEFEKGLPLLRAGGTGQAVTGEAQPLQDLGTSWACDGD